MATTQLTPSGIPGRPYGSFAGKQASGEPSGPHNPGVITQLRPSALPGGRYAFVAKGEAAEPPPIGQVLPPPVSTPYGPARGWPLVRRKRFDDELDDLCKEERKLEEQLENVLTPDLEARKTEEQRASLELVRERIAALEAQRDEDDLNDLMLLDELDDLED